MDFGGEKLGTVKYTNGNTADVNANDGLAINGGVVIVTGEFETQATIGYKFGGPRASNGSVTWDAIPVEIIEFYRTSIIRTGLGISYHINPKLVVDVPGSTSNGTTNYANALGMVLQIGWAPKEQNFSLDLRYTAIKFKEVNVANPQEVGGNVVGIYASAYFK